MNRNLFVALRRGVFGWNMDETADEFRSQLPLVKMILSDALAASLAKNGMTGTVPGDVAEAASVYAIQVIEYLVGELYQGDNPNASEAVNAFIVRCQGQLFDSALILMKGDQNTKVVIVQTLRMRLTLGAYRSPEYFSTPQGKRILELLEVFGGDVPDEVDAGKYSRMVNGLVAWSQSPEYPGKGLREPQ